MKIYNLSDPNEILAYEAGEVEMTDEGLLIDGQRRAAFREGEGIVGVADLSWCCTANITETGFCTNCWEHAA